MTGSAVLYQTCARASAPRQSNNAPFCSAPLRSSSCKSAFRGGHLAQLSRAHQRTVQQRNGSSLIVQAGLGGVGKYLSEAAAAVFSPTKEDVPWSGGKCAYVNHRMTDTMPPQALTSTLLCFALGNFSGKVSHHEGDVPRLRRLYKAVRDTREQLAGCMDPNVITSQCRGLLYSHFLNHH